MQDVSREFVVATKAGRMNCPYCKSSRTNLNGRREDKQTYLCRECGKRWMQKGAMGGHSFSPDLIGEAIQLYYNGFSLRKVARAIEEQFGIKKDISPEDYPQLAGQVHRCGDKTDSGFKTARRGNAVGFHHMRS